MTVVGASIEPLTIDAVSAEALKTVAALMDDPNPLHWDPAAGDRPLAQGPLIASWLMTLALRAARGGRVEAFDVRFLAPVYAGDRVECSGTVIAADAASATLDLRAVSGGRTVATGSVRISRSG